MEGGKDGETARHCAECNRVMAYAPGIGHYCPKHGDGPAKEDGETEAGVKSCLNCIYLASGHTPGIGLCGHEPTLPACVYGADKARIDLEAPHLECDCWQEDPTKATAGSPAEDSGAGTNVTSTLPTLGGDERREEG